MKMHRVTAAAAVALAGLVAATAAGAPAAYDESIHGDLIPGGGQLPVMQFDLGANTVRGVTSAGQQSDFDSFAFAIPAGMQIASATLETQFIDGGFQGADWEFLRGSEFSNNGEQLEVPHLSGTTGGIYTFSSMPQGQNVYNLSQVGLSAFNGLGQYLFTFNVTAVPEPMMLLPLALATLGLRRRRGMSRTRTFS